MEPGDFSIPVHRLIFEALVTLADAGHPLDFVTVCNALSDAGNLESVGGRAAVSDLIGGSLRLANLESYVGIIKDKSKLRRVMVAGDDLVKHAADPGADADTLLSVASNALELVRGSDTGALQLRRVADCKADPEPFPLIRRSGDRFGSVLAFGEVGILTGKGKVGKSTLARQIGAAAAGCPGDDNAWQEVAGLDVRSGAVVLVTFEDSDRRTYEACRLLADPIPERLHVMQAQGHALFGVPEGAPLHSRPQRLPAWFQVWAQIRRVPKPAW